MVGDKRVWRRARTEREAQRIQRSLVEMRELRLDPTRQTLAGFLRSWIDGLREAKRQRVRPRTLDHYAMIVERHIIPGLDPRGKVPLVSLTERDVQAWLDRDPAAPRTIRHHHAVLRRALNLAKRQRLIRDNPAIGAELPDAEYHGAKPLTMAEAAALLRATRSDRLHALWRLAIVSGLREGELLGLAWEDLTVEDRGNGYAGADRGEDGRGWQPRVGGSGGVGQVFRAGLTVKSQLQRRNREWVRVPPKVGRSLDRIALDAGTVAVLAEHRRRQAAERTPEWRFWGLMFVTARGEPYHGRVIINAFHAACDKAGIERRRFHDLRGSTATLMKDLGVAEDVRMARLGHETTAMARHYGQDSERQDREAVEALAEALA
jgi:integrase